MPIFYFEEVPRPASRATVNGFDDRRFFIAKATEDVGVLELLQERPDLRPGAPHPSIPFCRVAGFDPVRRADNWDLLDVTVSYSTNVEERQDNPLAEPAAISADSRLATVASILDGTGRVRTNTAGEILPAVEREVPRWVVHVQKNLPLDFPAWVETYAGAVNDASVRIRGRLFAKETLRLMELRIPRPERGPDGTPFVALSFALHHQAEGWFEFRPNVGFEESVFDADGRVIGRTRITTGDPTNPYPTEPVFLDEDGRALRMDVPDPTVPGRTRQVLKQPVEPEDIVILKFPVGERRPFGPLQRLMS